MRSCLKVERNPSSRENCCVPPEIVVCNVLFLVVINSDSFKNIFRKYIDKNPKV